MWLKMTHIRIRLRFDSAPFSYVQKCWFTFDSEKCRVVGDVSHLIASHFNLENAQGIQLYMDDYLIPTNENACLIRDNDTLQVRTIILTALECSSSDEDEGRPMTKRGKIAEKLPDTTSSNTSDSSSNSDRAMTRTVIKPVPPPVKKLVAITKKSASGGMHTKFKSSSSSSSDDNGDSSSSSSSSNGDNGQDVNAVKQTNTPPKKTQWDVKKKPDSRKSALTERLGAKQISNSKHATMKGILGRRADTIRKGKRFNRRKISADIVVGGPKDVFTTKTSLYTSPLGKDHVEIISDEETNNCNMNKKLEEKLIDDESVVGENTREPIEKSAEGVSDPSLEVAKDYTSFPDLKGPPRMGDKLAFKILELTSNYTPEVSEYRDATVMNFDPTTNTAKLKYTGNALLKLSKKDGNGNLGKFDLDLDEEDTVSQEEVNMTLSELIEPKLIT